MCFHGEMASLQPKDGPPIGNMASLLVFEDQAPLHEGATNDSETSSITEASAGSGDGDSDAYVAEPSDESAPTPYEEENGTAVSGRRSKAPISSDTDYIEFNAAGWICQPVLSR